MLDVDHAFCERLYVYDFNTDSMQSMEVVQTLNRTALFDGAPYRVREFGNPAKIQGGTQKYHIFALPKCQAVLS